MRTVLLHYAGQIPYAFDRNFCLGGISDELDDYLKRFLKITMPAHLQKEGEELKKEARALFNHGFKMKRVIPLIKSSMWHRGPFSRRRYNHFAKPASSSCIREAGLQNILQSMNYHNGVVRFESRKLMNEWIKEGRFLVKELLFKSPRSPDTRE